MKAKTMRRLISIFLCIALLLSYAPLNTLAATPLADTAIKDVIADPGTASSWESLIGTAADGNRYSGRVWSDKSVYSDGDTVVLNTSGEPGSSFTVELEDDEAFQVVFSTLGSTMSTTTTVSSTGPMDVVLVLDNSVSMNTTSGNITRMQRVIEAANSLLADLLDGNDVRLGIVAYSQDAATVLPFGTYQNGVNLRVNSYTGTGSRNGVITAYNKNGNVIDSSYKSDGYANYTNTQAGFDLAMEMLENATDTANRKPIVILLTDGAANTAVDTLFDNDRTGTARQVYYSNNIDPMVALSTLLSAAYNKASVEKHYGRAPMVYGIGVDLSSTDGSNAIINPAANFNSNNNNSNIRQAYNVYTNTWLAGSNVSVASGSGNGYMGSGSYTFRFGHEYPQGSGMTDAHIAANINYVDTYYPVTASEVQGVFDQIYEELSSGVFNPISSTTYTQGGTGVEHTPLIYVDYIDRFMEIKKLQSVTVFGASYDVIKNADGTYTVDMATGVNPTTNERWNTAEDILITITEQADGVQKLEIRIYQEILPIVMEKVVAETVGEVTTATITEFVQSPLRVYYTVGVDSDILLPNGSVDVTKLTGYEHIDAANGTVSFYLNQFGVVNDAAPDGSISKGDSHIGFKPSPGNRFYYHQANQRIFSAVTRTDGQPIQWENGLYGVVYNPADYQLTDIDYATYLQYNADYDNPQGSIDHQVYTYVTFWRPTADQTDAANTAEEVTYLVYTNWSDLRESVAFYDATAKTYLNNGEAIAIDQVAVAVEAYIRQNPNAEIYAVLGAGSLRTSRLHNMIIQKEENLTGTATERYTPEYTYETASQHNGNDVVVWLGNNGKLTANIDTGILLTKSVTEAIGSADDTYELTVTVPAGVTAAPIVVDLQGNTVASTYRNNVLTVNLKAEETVYISGIPGGTVCQIGEVVNGDYYIVSKTDTVTIPLVSDVLAGAAQFVPAVVTNAPNKYGNLFITKEITGDHAVPASVLDTAFEITVSLGSSLANKTFQVADSEHTAPYSKTADASGNMTFRLKAQQTVELLSLPAGTEVTVTETAPGSHFAVSYRTRNHSGEAADTDNALTIPAGGSATAVVLNRYAPTPISVDLDIAGTKNFTAEGNHPGGKFVYKVQKWNGSTWEDIAGKTAETPYSANETGAKTFTMENVLEGITYTQVGNYAYQVLEVKGDVANVTYDRTLYTFNVAVTDNGGQLEAKVTDMNNAPITDGSYEVTFHNTYHTVSVSLDVQKLVNNLSGDNTVSPAGFVFHVAPAGESFQPLTGAQSVTLYSDAAGQARFTKVYTQAGTYRYLLTEENTAAPGWTYSGAQYQITVTVTESNGELTAALAVSKVNSQNSAEQATVNAGDATRGTVSFVNTYDPADASVDLDGAVFKVLTGAALRADQFTFYVYEDGSRTAPVLMGTNGMNGDVRLVDFNGKLTFATAGKYEYDVVEAIPAEAVYNSATGMYVLDAMSYDPTIYDLVVEVTNDPATGRLIASYYFEDAVEKTVSFHNHYQASPTQYTLSGNKVLHGRALKAGEFSFELYEGDTLLETVTNKADGTFFFSPIPYTQAGTYTYTVKEAAGNVPGVRYDGANAPITVTVTVTDNNGVLTATANSSITFENTYTAAPVQITFNGTKKLMGGTLTDNAFSFNLYQTDNSFDITKTSSQLLATAKNVNGAFAFTRSLDTAGTYYFVVVEDTAEAAEGIVYDRTAHIFAVTVSDIGDGQLKASITNMRTGAASGDVSFTNATFQAVTKKEVYLADNTTAQIDGQKVNAGDTLTYFITYTNYTGQNIVVDIMDTIPEHTAYVEGSASHNGTYAGTHVNWVLNVPAGESVTVHFDVKVTKTEVIIANTAVVRDGANTYFTNEVLNHTVETALKKDVFAAGNANESIDGKQVAPGDQLLYTISFTNATRNQTNIRITDAIPAHTTYVAGSASSGGAYANGKLVWELENIPAWTTVTVQFQVTVTSGLDAVTIENQATAQSGSESYQSNLVSNFTEKQTPPVVPDPSNPKTGDGANLLLAGAMMLASSGGLITTTRLKKKKEED